MLPLWYSGILTLKTITAPSSDFHFFSFFLSNLSIIIFVCYAVSSSENQRATVASAFPSTFMWAPGQTIGLQVHTTTASLADGQLSRAYCHPTQYLYHRLTSTCSFYFDPMILSFLKSISHII